MKDESDREAALRRIPLLEQLHAKDPSDQDIIYMLSRNHRKSGNLDQAQQWAGKLNDYPFDPMGFTEDEP